MNYSLATVLMALLTVVSTSAQAGEYVIRSCGGLRTPDVQNRVVELTRQVRQLSIEQQLELSNEFGLPLGIRGSELPLVQALIAEIIEKSDCGSPTMMRSRISMYEEAVRRVLGKN